MSKLIAGWTVMTAGVWGTVLSGWLYGFGITPLSALSLTAGIVGANVAWRELRDT